MRVLFVTATPLEYSSSANVRNIALIRGMTELGHKIYTYSTKPDFNSNYYDRNLIKDIKFTKRFFTDLTALHSNLVSKRKHNIYKKWIIEKIYKIYTSFRIYDSRYIESDKIPNEILQERFDLIISSSDPKSSHLFAENLIKKKPEIAKKWIQYWGDPFSGDINLNYLLPKKNIQREEYRLLSKADKIVYVSPLTKKMICDLYPSLSNIFFIPVPYSKTKGSFTDNLPINNRRFTISYLGDYYTSDRNIFPLFEAAKFSQHRWNFIGNSDVMDFPKNDNIFVSKRISKEEIQKVENTSDILVCLLNKNGTQIPGKIYHYSATNKAILIILDGENKMIIKEYFDQFDRYYFCENSSESIKNTINLIEMEIANGKQWMPNQAFVADKIAIEFLKEI